MSKAHVIRLFLATYIKILFAPEQDTFIIMHGIHIEASLTIYNPAGNNFFDAFFDADLMLVKITN